MQKKFDYKRCEYDYLPEEKRKDYIFNAKSEERMLKEKLLSKLDPFGESVVTFNQRLSDHVVHEFELGDLREDDEDYFDEKDYQYADAVQRFYDEEDEELFFSDQEQ